MVTVLLAIALLYHTVITTASSAAEPGGPAAGRCLDRCSERDEGQKPGERGVGGKVVRPHPSPHVERSRIEEPLLHRSAKKEVPSSQSQIECRVIVRRRLSAQSRCVMEVLHEERIVEVDGDRNFRHLVKPGITGWAQVNGWRGDTAIAERVAHDLYYVENWGMKLDVKILVLTVRTFFHGNAY